MSTLRLLKRATQIGAVTSAVYASGIWYASNHSEFQRYVPLSHTIIDFLEEREYHSQHAYRARRALEEEANQLNDSFYYRRVESTASASSDKAPTQSHQVSQITSAVTPSSNVSALTSRLDQEISAEDRQKSTISRNNATSATNSKDPLTPTRFFDAVSGTVGKSRGYLPLVLLPDESDKDINKVAMSLNDLIASINNSVVTEESVLNVTSTLEELAESKASVKPHYANEILVKSEKFDELYQAYRLLWDEYLDNSPSATSKTGEINPVVAEYTRKLSREIIDTEMLLVKLINSKKDMELTQEQKDVEFQTDYYRVPKHNKNSKTLKDTTPQPSESAVSSQLSSLDGFKPASADSSVQTNSLDPKKYGALEPSDISLQLELALTLLVNALHQHSSVPLGPYIQGVRQAFQAPYKTFHNDHVDKATLLTEALKTINIPQDVDLKPVLDDILSGYEDSHKR